jgi:hypothetical protein
MTQCVETRGPTLRAGWRAPFWPSAKDLWTAQAAHFSYYNMLRWMDVHDSARKHGIADAGIARAITHHLYAGDIAENEGPPWRVLYLGPDHAGNLLEVVAVERDDGTELAIHAMRMRKRYEPLLPRSQEHDHD